MLLCGGLGRSPPDEPLELELHELELALLELALLALDEPPVEVEVDPPEVARMAHRGFDSSRTGNIRCSSSVARPFGQDPRGV